MHPTVQLSARATPDVMIRNGGGRHAAESADVITGMRRLTPFLRDLCSDLIRIPMVGAADSLNLAVAGSLFLYEVYRARSARRVTPKREAR